MPPRPPDPLSGTDRLLVDGSNLLHALRRGAGADDTPRLPATALIGRLRAAIRPEVGIELVLDGVPEPGMAHTRVASGLIVRYSGRRSADQLLFDLADAAAREATPDNLLVVTDDRDLRLGLQARGVRTAGTRWLLGRLERRRIESPLSGQAQPSPSPDGASDDEDGDTRPLWRAGRGATTKRGNPKKGSRRHRSS